MKKAVLIIQISAFLFLNSISSYSRLLVVDQEHSKASDDLLSGTIITPFKSISKAAELAMPGDTVLVYPGIYRERVAPARGGVPGQPIVYLAAGKSPVIIKGSEIWENQWLPVKGRPDLYESRIDVKALGNYNPFYISLARIPGRKSLGQIICNGERLTQVDSLDQLAGFPGSWMLSYDSLSIVLHYPSRYLSIPFKDAMIEYSARDKIFAPHRRGLGYITVEGFIMEHCANQFPSGFYNNRGKGHPQAGALSCRAGHHWVIRGNTIRLAKNLAIDCGYEGRWDLEGDQPTPPGESIGFHLIEFNSLFENGCGGIAGATQHESIIRYNRIERNNYLGHTAPETGAIKVHFFYKGRIEGNLIRDNHCLGIWLDNQWYESRVTRNVILNNNGSGIFIELGSGPCMIDNNIVADNHDGIYMHDASGVTLVHNLLAINKHFGLYARYVTERRTQSFREAGRELAGTRNLSIMNNLFIDNFRGQICLPLEDGERTTNNRCDYNLLISGTQWNWEGLGFNSFSVTGNDKRITSDSIYMQLILALQDAGYSEEALPGRSQWMNQQFLTLDWWRILTGNDVHSFAPEIHTGKVDNGAIEKGAISISAPSLSFLIRSSASLTRWHCPKMDGVDYDFYKKAMGKNEVLPGPFQKYGDGEVQFNLMPFPIKNSIDESDIPY